MNASSKNDTGADSGEHETNLATIPLLETIRRRGRVWRDLASQYGVTNPDPPWKVNLEATCDALSAEACALPLLERRSEEDELSASLYANVPFPERQLLALAHSMIKRGLVDEKELASRMKQVHDRLISA
ncbi:MAG: hypothetical protein OEM95_11475 [Gammaproteobacteria bacterium]|nr:hypothetical protein [Gammaproteobacteria bacterium]